MHYKPYLTYENPALIHFQDMYYMKTIMIVRKEVVNMKYQHQMEIYPAHIILITIQQKKTASGFLQLLLDIE